MTTYFLTLDSYFPVFLSQCHLIFLSLDTVETLSLYGGHVFSLGEQNVWVTHTVLAAPAHCVWHTGPHVPSRHHRTACSRRMFLRLYKNYELGRGRLGNMI